MTGSFVVRGFYSVGMDALRGVSTGTAVVDRRVSALPDGVATLRPGPELAAALATVDRSTVTADELPDLVKARARLIAYAQAEFLLDLAEAAHGACAEPGSTDRYHDTELVDSATVELSWALRWSPTWTSAQVDFAQGLRDRLPTVLQALREGRIDRERAYAFVDALRCLDQPLAQTIATKLLPKALSEED